MSAHISQIHREMTSANPDWLSGHWRKRDVLYWVGVAAVVPLVGRAIWWTAEKSYNLVTPYHYHYRPGTITGWIASLLGSHAERRRKRAPIRVYMDGCFDMMHYGHANALRQAKALGDELVVGLVPDSEIRRCKGPPVMNEDERHTMVSSVKWVDEVLTGVPYDLTPAFLDELLAKHRIDYVIHGDDPCILPDGTDAYAYAKKIGRFRLIKRTEGVSSTDIVGRMLMCTRVNPRLKAENEALAREFSRTERTNSMTSPSSAVSATIAEAEEDLQNHSGVSKFMPTSRRIVQFSEGRIAPAGARIVYVDGAFDLFHPGHVAFLQLARQQGDFLLVGLHSDEDVTARRGPHLPLMDLHERSLSVLACKFVDEVIIGSSLEVTEDLLTTFNIAIVARGSISETGKREDGSRYNIPRFRNIYRQLDSPSDMATASIVKRIVSNRQAFEDRNARKVKSETAYYENQKSYMAEG